MEPQSQHDGRNAAGLHTGEPTGFLFSHRDSRGGETLVLARTLSAAAALYESAFGDEPGSVAANDFVRTTPVLSYGEVLPEGGELLETYGGPFRAFWFEVEDAADTNDEPLALVLVAKGTPEPTTEDVTKALEGRGGAFGIVDRRWAPFQLRDDTEELGEDAFGLVLDRA